MRSRFREKMHVHKHVHNCALMIIISELTAEETKKNGCTKNLHVMSYTSLT
jgi:hypothetical protein